MTTRLPTAERRDQIVAAALDLLATTPIDGLSTRAIADAVGLTQPALFRHFPSRDALLVDVVAEARRALRARAEAALDPGLPWEPTLRAIVAGLLAEVAARPGLPRLLFHDAAAAVPSAAREALLGLAAMQAGLFGRLATEGQAAGEVPPHADADAAGEILLALIQGTIARWLAAGAPPDLPLRAAPALELWLAGLRAGQPPRLQAPPAPTERMQRVDVRPILAAGREPLPEILAAVDRLAADGALLLVAPFHPRPLVQLLERRGLRVAAEPIDGDVVLIEILGPLAAPPLELRELEAPEPMARVLTAAAALPPGGSLLARVPRLPRLLLPRLSERGLTHAIAERPDGAALVHVARRP